MRTYSSRLLVAILAAAVALTLESPVADAGLLEVVARQRRQIKSMRRRSMSWLKEQEKRLDRCAKARRQLEGRVVDLEKQLSGARSTPVCRKPNDWWGAMVEKSKAFTGHAAARFQRIQRDVDSLMRRAESITRRIQRMRQKAELLLGSPKVEPTTKTPPTPYLRPKE